MSKVTLTEEDYIKLSDAVDVIEEIMKKLGINRFTTTRKSNELMFDQITVINRHEDVYRKI